MAGARTTRSLASGRKTHSTRARRGPRCRRRLGVGRAPSLDRTDGHTPHVSEPEGWTEVDDALERTFAFDSFVEALAFVNRVGRARGGGEPPPGHPDRLPARDAALVDAHGRRDHRPRPRARRPLRRARAVARVSTRRVTVCDVGPRDGLQNEPDVVSPDVRAELASRLARCGLPRGRGRELRRSAPRSADGRGGGGRGRARAGGRRRLRGARAQRARLRAPRGDRARRGPLRLRRHRVVQPAQPERLGRGVAGLGPARRPSALEPTGSARRSPSSVAFGCPFEGRVDESRVLELATALAEARPDALVLADTIGVATPSHVRRLVARVAALGVPVGGHFHNTRNTGYANALAALEAGASVLDASIGGLGGCPFAPRATGNIATEDLVYLLDGEGVETGVDLGRARRRVGVARGRARAPARGPGLPRRRLPARVVGAPSRTPGGSSRAPRRARRRPPARGGRPRRRPRGTSACGRRRGRAASHRSRSAR